MPGETLFNMRGRVKEVAPNRSQPFVDGAINKYIRMVTQRDWAGLLRYGQIIIPQAYSAGTVSLSPGLSVATGLGTAWPTNDVVNTTLSAAVSEAPGYVDISPASMAGVAVGKYCLLDTGGSAEIIVPIAVAATRFRAYCQLPHNSGVALKASSLAGLQFRANAYVYTVMAVLSGTSIQLDMPYGGPAQSGLSYLIYLGYATITTLTRKLLLAYDAIAGNSIGTGKTRDWLDAADPQRSSSGDPQELVGMQPSPAGVMQWEIWPPKTSPYAIGVVYQESWPKLVQDNDLSPHFLNPEIFIAGAQSDSRRTKFLPNVRGVDPYYDLDSAQADLGQFKSMLDDAIEEDQGRYLTMLQNYQQKMVGGGNYNWLRSHAPWPSDGE